MSTFELDEQHGKRPTWDAYFMNIARAAAQRSTCPRRAVGAALVLDKRLIATGYNGSPAGLDHCPATDKEGHEDCMEHGHCVRTVHAEVNAIIACAQGGQSTQSAVLYTTTFPCRGCMGAIINAGIRIVIYADPYEDPTHAKNVQAISRHMAHQADVAVYNMAESEGDWVGVQK